MEVDLVKRYAGVGVAGSKKIKLYIDARIKIIEEHNAAILEAVLQETIEMRNATRGMGVVTCPECAEEVYWGALIDHRTRLCRNCRV